MAHKLLLADDSVTIQRVIELTFADEDIDVTLVGDGQQAIDRLDADPPDIILADIDMPKRDGYEVAAYVKSRPTLAHIPVVLLMGAFEPIDEARAAAVGSSDVLAKPFEPQMVINRVKELLGKKQPQGAEVYASAEAAPSHDTQPQLSDPQPAGREPAGTNAQSVSLDDYFDQLDAAFSNLQPGGASPEASSEIEWPADILDTRTAPTAAPAVTNSPTPPGPEAPIAASIPVAPPPSVAAVAPMELYTSVAPITPVAPIAPVAAMGPVAPMAPLPAPVADVSALSPKPTSNPFANLSAAKAEAAARSTPAGISDQVIEEIVSRVLLRMTDRVVRETVADVVSQTAERLVQEEIERIRTGT